MSKHFDGPMISLVVPVYGTEQYFDRCIQSLLNQSYKNIEIIVVNDGSKGNIVELMEEYLSDARVQFINNQQNRGLLRARVCGSKAAHGEYIAFVDSDDYVSLDFYRTLVTKASDENSDITIGKTVWDADGRRYVYNYHESCFQFDNLTGKAVKENYFKQETQCYSWHTVWNKLYKKSLWDQCLPEFETVDEHIIMTEDIYFSSILFFNAKKVARVNNDAYFYCVNENASTDSHGITINRFVKNIHDIKYVFDKTEKYLREHDAEDTIISGFRNGRAHYARMWGNLAESTFSSEDKDQAMHLIEEFCSDLKGQKVKDDYFFESVQTPWNGGLEYIKQQILEAKESYISFDVFDTLVKRPFYEPSDIFKLLDQPFSELIGNSISFSKIRVEGESLAREFYGKQRGYEDVTLDEIYDFISSHYSINRTYTDQIKKLERRLEVKYCHTREAGKELFELAKTIGKKIVLITDMYLDRETIENILKTDGICGYEKLYISCEERRLKYNGRLFIRAMNDLHIQAEDMLHIGDTWESDVEGSKRAGVRSIFFPKAREIFESKIEGCTTNRCADIAKASCGKNINYSLIKDNIGFRCMQAIVANRYFDNPYRTFNAESDFNMDPYFMGYYLVGMHIFGIVKWLQQTCNDLSCDMVTFLARDGFLPMKIFEQYTKYTKSEKRVLYLQASRKALMPMIVSDKINFFQLPIEYRAHSPKTLIEVLKFADKGMEENEWIEKLQEFDIHPEQIFTSLDEFHKFIHVFLEYRYDSNKHEKAKENITTYYSVIPDNSITFDMGYSGRIQSAISEAVGRPINGLFIHEDYNTSIRMRGFSNFQLKSFYEFRPAISGLMREHIFSDINGSCISFKKDGDNVVPIFETVRHAFPDRYIVETLQQGAMDFTKTFLMEFGDCLDVVDFSAQEVSLPFEGFLRCPEINDMHIFSASYFEDLVYGARTEINIEEFAMQNLASMGWNPRMNDEKAEAAESASVINPEDERITNLINHSSQLKRAFVWLILDWKFFKEKLGANIKRIIGK